MSIKSTFRNLHIEYLKCRLTYSRPIALSDSALIIAPHPDDEVIGCGGLIARLVAEGKTPHIVIMTRGEGSHHGCCTLFPNEIQQARSTLSHKALSALGVGEEYVHQLDFTDGGIAADTPQVTQLRDLILALNPSSIFVPHWGEGWPDHVNAANLVKKLTEGGKAEVYEYCVWMWYYNVWRGLDWKNAFKLSMTPQEHQLKLKAMDIYVKPLAPCGKPWSGVLPPIFLKANSGNTELYFKVK